MCPLYMLFCRHGLRGNPPRGNLSCWKYWHITNLLAGSRAGLCNTCSRTYHEKSLQAFHEQSVLYESQDFTISRVDSPLNSTSRCRSNSSCGLIVGQHKISLENRRCKLLSLSSELLYLSKLCIYMGLVSIEHSGCFIIIKQI